uniref:Uncharacterized protein n=1 Tax=Arundo donax TaxID=35708 RepID=A0A0A9GJE7_ARUDO
MCSLRQAAKISSRSSYTIQDRDKKREAWRAAATCGSSPDGRPATSNSLPRCRRPRGGRARSCSP